MTTAGGTSAEDRLTRLVHAVVDDLGQPVAAGHHVTGLQRRAWTARRSRARGGGVGIGSRA